MAPSCSSHGHPLPRPRRSTTPRSSPGKRGSRGRAALEVRAVFQLLKYVKLFSFQRSCRLNTFPSFPMYLNTRGLEPRPREYAPPPHHHLKPPAPCRSEIISRLTRYSRETNRGNIVDHRFPLRPQNEEYLL